MTAHLRDVVGRHGVRGEAARGDDHVVALLPQPGGADAADLAPDVVPVQVVPLQGSQGRHVLVENIDLEIALGLHTGGHQASLRA